jgi:hypothetical protein
MTQTEPTPAVRPSADVVARRIGDGAVLVHLPTNRIFELNHTAARLWELLEEGLDHAQILARLAEEFEVDEARTASDLDQCVQRFRRDGLLR